MTQAQIIIELERIQHKADDIGAEYKQIPTDSAYKQGRSDAACELYEEITNLICKIQDGE